MELYERQRQHDRFISSLCVESDLGRCGNWCCDMQRFYPDETHRLCRACAGEVSDFIGACYGKRGVEFYVGVIT